MASSYAPLFTRLRGTRLRTQITQLRYLAPDVALIQAQAGVGKPGGGRWIRHRERINNSIAVRTVDGWRLAASQHTTHHRFTERLLGALTFRQSHA
ncbi:nuclear transport factor 2 family protein [Mycolicibacterium palauense]|uniref:hypothetical protein n=1 Tax=Mycolicibacterium palauense TaxID=2034511 RepID=UPI002E20B9F5